MKATKAIRVLFAVASLYDILLGLVFLFAGNALFQWCGVTPPNHPGYVQFPAGLLVTFGLMFMVIAMKPHKYRHLIPYGMLLKLSYCGTILFHWSTDNMPGMWKPFCIFDLVFLALFAWAWLQLRGQGHPPVRVLASIRVKAGEMDSFLKIFKDNVHNVKAEDGCLDYLPVVDVESAIPIQSTDDRAVTVIETWENLAALRAHLVAPHMAVYRKKVKDLVEDVSLKVLTDA